MNCSTAQLEMQRRLDADPAEPAGGFAELDAHLARCPRCARLWLEMLDARRQLGALRTAGPTPEEIDSMWQAIDAAVPAQLPVIPLPARAIIYRFMSATGAVAACLFLAFLLGEQRYGNRRNAPAMSSGPHPADLHPIASAKDPHAVDAPGVHEAPINADGNRGRSVESSAMLTNEWMVERSGGLELRRYFSPSASEAVVGDLGARGDFADKATISFGHQASHGLPAHQANQSQAGAAFTTANSALADSALSPDYLTDRAARLDAKLGRAGARGNTVGTVQSVERLSDHEDAQQEVGKTFAGREIQSADALTLLYYAEVNSSPTSPPTPDSAGIALGFQAGNDETAESAGVQRAETDRWHFGGYSIAEARESDGVADAVAATGAPAAAFGALTADGDLDEAQPKDPASRSYHSHTGDAILTAAGQPGQAEPASQPVEARAPEVQGALATQSRPRDTKVIKTGALATEVEDYEQAIKDVSSNLDRFDCFLADASTKEAAGGALIGELVIRVSPVDFEGLFAALRQVGRLESEDIKSADVTAEYVDIEARIAALRITEERLVELVKSKSFVDRMEDLLKVEQEMNRVRTEIEQNEGRLRVMADRVALSTIAMTLREPARTVPSAAISVEVPVLDEAAAALGEALVALDARMVSGKVTQLDQGALVGEYRVQVSLARFGQTLTAISNLGRVEARDVRDWREQSAGAKWADRVACDVALKLFERTRDLPSGAMTVQVDHLPKAMAALDELLPASEAAVTSNRTNKRNDGSSSADLQVRIPAGEFSALVAKLDALGRVTARQLAGEAGSIAGGAADTPCTLSLTLAEPVRQIPSGGMVIEVQTFANARDRLADLVGKHGIQLLASNSSQRTDGTWVGQFQLGITASGIDTAVGDLEKLGKVSSREIRGIGLGELSKIDANALGVLEIILAEKAAINPGAEGNTIRSYLRDGLSGLYASLGLIAYGLVVMAPWLVIAIVAGWFITRLWKRRKLRMTAGSKPA